MLSQLSVVISEMWNNGWTEFYSELQFFVFQHLNLKGGDMFNVEFTT